MTSPPPIVPLATLADLGITSHRGRDWARDEIVSALADAGCPAPPDGPASDLILDIAGMRLARAIASALPERMHLLHDTIWGPRGTDLVDLQRQAMHWRDQAGVGEIVARTGLWSPPSLKVVPTVRIEARIDQVTGDGQRIGELATRAQAQYWAVYGVLPDGQLDLAADFATEEAASRYAARWQRPGLLVTADHSEALPDPAAPGGVTGLALPSARRLAATQPSRAGHRPLPGTAHS